MFEHFLQIEEHNGGTHVLRLRSEDGTNRMTRQCVLSLTDAIQLVAAQRKPLVIAGNNKFFSAGADLKEIAALNGPSAYEFSKTGQELMSAIENSLLPCMPRSPDTAWAAAWISRSLVIGGLLRRTPSLDIGVQRWDSSRDGEEPSGCRG